MCGINLIISKKREPVNPDVVREANRSIRHRGPDDEQIYCWKNIGLGFVRLSIIDLEGGRQPFVSEDRQKVLVCNGEIYNFRQLRNELEGKGHVFSSQNDSEVILHLYEEEPQTFVSRLEGMFAFVLLDQRNRKILLTRDRTGIKPLFYTNCQDIFACSSEIRGIFPALPQRPALYPPAIMDAFTFGYPQGQATCFLGIVQVPPAEMMIYSLDDHSIVSHEYWHPPFIPEASKNRAGMSFYSHKLKEVLTEAVASHTMADVPISAYLSGGLDSTTIAALLQQTYSQPNNLATFSIKFADPAFDESAIFEKTSALMSLKSNIISVDQLTADDFIAACRILEQPQFSSMDIPMQRLSAYVHEQNRKVVLVGEGADELLGGYISFVLSQARRALFMPIAEPVRPLLMKKVVEFFLGRSQLTEELTTIYSQTASDVQERFGTFPAWYPWWLLNYRSCHQLFTDMDYYPLGENSHLTQTVNKFRDRIDPLGDYDKSLYIELKTRLPNYILSRADRNSMHNSVELRLPFLDNHVIDFAVTVPELYKMFALKEKYILRKAMSNLLPKHVLSRRKFGYNSPMDWIWKNKTAQSQELLSVSALKKTGIFNVDVVLNQLKKLDDPTLSSDSMLYNELARQLTGVLSVQALALTP